MQRLADFPRGAFGSMVVEAVRLWRIGGLPRTVNKSLQRLCRLSGCSLGRTAGPYLAARRACMLNLIRKV
jgi:hypothetical protein